MWKQYKVLYIFLVIWALNKTITYVLAGEPFVGSIWQCPNSDEPKQQSLWQIHWDALQSWRWPSRRYVPNTNEMFWTITPNSILIIQLWHLHNITCKLEGCHWSVGQHTSMITCWRSLGLCRVVMEIPTSTWCTTYWLECLRTGGPVCVWQHQKTSGGLDW